MKRVIVLLVLFSNIVFAKSLQSSDFVYVTKSVPIYKNVTIKKPIQECYEQSYNQKVNIESEYDNNSIGLDTIIGATAGVVIGNQIGKGNGKIAAQIVGGLLGGKVANEIRNTSSDDYYYETKTRTKCITKYKTVKNKKVIKAYKNYFILDGQEYFKITKKAKNRIKITKTITY